MHAASADSTAVQEGVYTLGAAGATQSLHKALLRMPCCYLPPALQRLTLMAWMGDTLPRAVARVTQG